MTDVSQPGTEPQSVASRRLKYALIASLALNLLIIGAVAGTMYGVKRHFPQHGSREDFGLMGLTRFLPDDRRKEIRKELKEDKEKLRPLIEDSRVARRAAADQLAAEPFDRAALESAIAKVGEKELVLRQTAIAAFLGHAERLQPNERKMLADWWRKKSEGFRRFRKKDKDTSPDAAPKT